MGWGDLMFTRDELKSLMLEALEEFHASKRKPKAVKPSEVVASFVRDRTTYDFLHYQPLSYESAHSVFMSLNPDSNIQLRAFAIMFSKACGEIHPNSERGKGGRRYVRFATDAEIKKRT